jgi:hypothetical protein
MVFNFWRLQSRKPGRESEKTLGKPMEEFEKSLELIRSTLLGFESINFVPLFIVDQRSVGGKTL